MNRYTIFLPLFGLTACVTPYKDPRPEPVQKAELSIALKEFTSEYSVVDSRNDDYKEYGSLKVEIVNGLLIIKMRGKRETLVFASNDCRGYSKDQEQYINLFCDSNSSDVSFFEMEKLNAQRVIKDGAMIGGFQPLTVGPGSYLLGFWSHGGRPHYFVLKK